jgi:hypothetical protein
LKIANFSRISDDSGLYKVYHMSLQFTVGVTGGGAGVDNSWEQKILEARKMLENGDESPPSSARCVSLL